MLITVHLVLLVFTNLISTLVQAWHYELHYNSQCYH